MDERNVKNIDKVFELIDTVWGLDNKSIEYIKKELYSPTIDSLFGVGFDENFRKSWEIDFNSLPEGKEKEEIINTDAGWRYFCLFFNTAYKNIDIKYIEYRNNKKRIGKNELKIRKILIDYYSKNSNSFAQDVLHGYQYCDSSVCHKYKMAVRSEKYCSMDKSPRNKEYIALIDEYITKTSEKIGEYKTSTKKLKAVLSFNFADWFLCSTGENWTSCLSLDGGIYFKGIVSLIGDKNRAFLYITDGTKKVWNGIEVERVIARTWVLLTDKDEKMISRFYPTKQISSQAIIALTGDPSYIEAETSSEKKSKNELFPITFKTQKMYYTVFNDACALDSQALKEGKLKWVYSSKGGFQYYSFKLKTTLLKTHTFSSNFMEYKKHKKLINSDIDQLVCSCGYVENIESDENDFVLVNSDNKAVCKTCAETKYEKCSYCDTYYHKWDIVKLEYIGRICSKCYSKKFLKKAEKQ